MQNTIIIRIRIHKKKRRKKRVSKLKRLNITSVTLIQLKNM